jgi:hypothetical protein
MTTIVSGFIDLTAYDSVKRLPLKTTEYYIEQASYLLRLPHNKIIFVEKKYLPIFQFYANEHTLFIPFEKEEMWLWTYREEILDAKLPIHRNLQKDTHDYMMVMLQKTDWVRRAIKMNPYNSNQFVWIDLGIHWIMKDINAFNRSIESIVSKFYENVRIAGCWDVKSDFMTYDAVMWYYLGGVFGGSSNALLTFDEQTKKYAMETLRKGRWVWEVNIWFLVHKACNGLLTSYVSDHNITMLERY